MDHFDRDRYITIYNCLAEILERERPSDPPENHLSFVLGDLTRRIFIETPFLPPDEILEESGRALRATDRVQVEAMARRLREHAEHLSELDE